MSDLVCRADPTNLYIAYAVAGVFAVAATAFFVKNLDRLRAAVRRRD